MSDRECSKRSGQRVRGACVSQAKTGELHEDTKTSSSTGEPVPQQQPIGLNVGRSKEFGKCKWKAERSKRVGEYMYKFYMVRALRHVNNVRPKHLNLVCNNS